jgi:hypothetical protein
MHVVQVLAADVTFGYHCQFGRLNSVNGVNIMNIYQLANVCDNCTSEFVIFDLQPRAPPFTPPFILSTNFAAKVILYFAFLGDFFSLFSCKDANLHLCVFPLTFV